jgi:hypothetical protein
VPPKFHQVVLAIPPISNVSKFDNRIDRQWFGPLEMVRVASPRKECA